MGSGVLTCTRMRIVRGPPSTWSQGYRDAREAVLGGRALRCQSLMLASLVREEDSVQLVAAVLGRISRKVFGG